MKLASKMERRRLWYHIMHRCSGTLTQQCLTTWHVPLTGSQV